ncbi:MAG: DUF11 domain-containing protein [Rubrobacter sp.]|nr:DUF11 domain-containing protein [Rubrobacter sp.]
MIFNGGSVIVSGKRRLGIVFVALLAALFASALFSDPAWAQANLSITKQGPAEVEPGEEFVYTIVVRNTGDMPATTVEVTDRLPEGVEFLESEPADIPCVESNPGGDPRDTVTCTVVTIPAGESETIRLRVTAPATPGEIITNRATVDSAETDPENSNVVTTDVTFDLVLTKEDDPDPVREDGLLSYTLTVENEGEEAANPIVIRDELPDSVEFVAAFPTDNGECEQNDDIVTCRGFDNVTSDDPVSVRILVVPLEQGTITNEASVFLEGQRNNPLDEVTEDTLVQGEVDPDDPDDPFPPFDPDGPFGPFPPFDPDIDDDGIIDAIDEDIDDLAEAEADLFGDEITDGEGTDGQYDDAGNDGVSATADENGAEASTPGASASAGGDPDEQAPVSGEQGDVVDEVPTSGPLPNTGGVPVAAGTVLALVLFGGGLLAVRLVMVWRERRA